MKWINNPKQWHRLWSMRLLILTTAYTTAAGAWVVLPADWQPHLSETTRAILAVVGVLLPTLAGVSRLIRQDALQPDDTERHDA